MRISCGVGCVLLLILAGFSSGGGDDKIKATGRTVLANHKDAVISVKFAGFQPYEENGKLLKSEFNGEVTGTILSPSGLTALCLHSIRQGAGVNEKIVFTDFDLLMAGGGKLPAKILFRDEKAGVMFIAPKKKQSKLPFVQMDKGKAPDVLDQLIIVNRLDSEFDGEAEVAIGRVAAVVKKPVAALVTSFSEESGGCPIFDAAGRPVGLGVLRPSGVLGSRHVVIPPEALHIGKLVDAIKLWEKSEK